MLAANTRTMRNTTVCLRAGEQSIELAFDEMLQNFHAHIYHASAYSACVDVDWSLPHTVEGSIYVALVNIKSFFSARYQIRRTFPAPPTAHNYNTKLTTLRPEASGVRRHPAYVLPISQSASVHPFSLRRACRLPYHPINSLLTGCLLYTSPSPRDRG